MLPMDGILWIAPHPFQFMHTAFGYLLIHFAVLPIYGYLLIHIVYAPYVSRYMDISSSIFFLFDYGYLHIHIFMFFWISPHPFQSLAGRPQGDSSPHPSSDSHKQISNPFLCVTKREKQDQK